MKTYKHGEMIVGLKQNHVKTKGCEYVRDLIRCKDCIHHASFLPWCKEHETRMNDNDYCSKGEHK